MTDADINISAEAAVAAAIQGYQEIEIFLDGWAKFFLSDPALNKGAPPAVHSVRTRMKNKDHLRDKILRKIKEKKEVIDETNVFVKVTDLGGIRVLHLHQDQFAAIHGAIIRRIDSNKLHLVEPAVAYTWDPESVSFFKKHEINVIRKESSYTSVHYTVRPFRDSFICCEIQVRTLFEEAWGEIEHAINYPNPTSDRPCLEQIAVLAKLVGAGTRLADSIFRTYQARGSAGVAENGTDQT